MSEVWKAVVGFEGLYEVSDQGRVRSLDRFIWCEGPVKGRYTSLKRGRLLRPGVASNGYPTVALGRGNTRTLHSLVAEAFIGPCPWGQEVRHKDGDRKNPAAHNLEYGSRSENNIDASRHGRRRISKATVSEIKRSSAPQSNLARAFGVSPSHVSNIKNGRQRVYG